MSIPVLLVSTATRWLGTARVPSALAQAGFTVALLTPRNSLAEKSRHVAKLGYLPENATIDQWVAAFAGAVKATLPRIVIPCDDMAFRLLAMLVRTPPARLQPALQWQLAALIRESLGDPAYYDVSVDKTRLPQAAGQLGVAVPPYAIVSEPAQCMSFIEAHGYPVLLKRAHGFAGEGIAICADRDQLTGAFARFAAPEALDLDAAATPRLLLQKRIPGKVQYYLATARQGELLAGLAGEKVLANPEPTGPPTVLRYFRAPRLRAITATLAKGFGISGHFFVEFIVREDDGEPVVLEINRRVTPSSHRGRARNVDHWAALHASLTGTTPTTRTDLDEGEEGLGVRFPEEWLRDPQSPYLREYPVDVPWDEPELIEALLALRHVR